MAEIVLSPIVEALANKLGSSAMDEIASAWRFKESLDRLRNTLTMVNYMLSDAEERQFDSQAIRGWLESLSAVVYTADDLFDKFSTMASKKEAMGGNKLVKEIKKIREYLDDIVRDGNEFAFRLNPNGGIVHRKKLETISFVDTKGLIGREDDKNAILNILLTSTSQECGVSVIPIVGIGGMGKTALAQLIYNDDLIKKSFDLRLWVCVSNVFDIEALIRNILMSATNIAQKQNIEQLQDLLQTELREKKYLLVLDDVWNENSEKWRVLSSLLKLGKEGSKIVVTTRSREVARIMGTVDPYYELKGLSNEKAWELFEDMAFAPGQAQQKPDLVKVGEEIVKKCANVPLAIRIVASLLNGRDECKWLSFKDRSLADISNGEDSIIEILKLSYQHLRSPLKKCFTYCALFPKAYEFDKEMLMNLWMAEGFVISENNKSLEEVAEDCFRILLQRCFFQDIKEDEWGNIVSCKMHDLMHVLAQQEAKVNCKVAKVEESNSNKGIHHLSFAYCLTSEWKIPSWLPNLKHLRTFLLPEQNKDGSAFSKSICQELISVFGCLRVLDLHNLGIRNLPSSIGKLIHLRYLNLSHTPIRELPDSITMLQNLQTLNLYNCWSLGTLPLNMGLLKSLRSLDVGGCRFLFRMPSGLGKLTSLNKLPRFTVVYKNSPKIKYKPNSAKLSDLKNLNKLKGVLNIEILGELKNTLSEATDANLNGKHGLTKLHIEFDQWLYEDVNGSNHDDAILEGLKPHSNLRVLEIFWYRGQELPSWIMKNNLCLNLPKLVKIQLLRCGRCQQVPCFSQLPSLKHLSLLSLPSIEYMESSPNDLSSSSKSPTMSSLFFPSLQELTLMSMDNLKGWWKETRETANHDTKEVTHQIGQHLLSMSISNLSKLWIQDCPKLISLPLCPNVEELTLVGSNKSISVSNMAAATPSTSTSGSASKLKKLTISNVEDLISLPRHCLHQLSSLQVQDERLLSTEDIGGKVFTSISSTLRSLEFVHCHSLRYFAQGLEHLTAIEKLKLSNCAHLDLLPSPDEQLPWEYFKNLRSLQFHSIPKLLVLPSGLQHLTNLRSLNISWNEELRELPEWISCFSTLGYLELYACPKLKSLPEGFCKLTALNQLRIMNCPGLTERCRRPNGSDWPKIQHIPLVTVLRDRRDG